MGPGGRPGPGEEGGTCSGLQLGEGAGRVRGCPRSEPGLHHDSGDWEEGGAAELRAAVSALRLRSSQGTGSSRRKQVGSAGAGPEAGSRASAPAAQVALAEPWELVAKPSFSPAVRTSAGKGVNPGTQKRSRLGDVPGGSYAASMCVCVCVAGMLLQS